MGKVSVYSVFGVFPIRIGVHAIFKRIFFVSGVGYLEGNCLITLVYPAFCVLCGNAVGNYAYGFICGCLYEIVFKYRNDEFRARVLARVKTVGSFVKVFYGDFVVFAVGNKHVKPVRTFFRKAYIRQCARFCRSRREIGGSRRLIVNRIFKQRCVYVFARESLSESVVIKGKSYTRTRTRSSEKLIFFIGIVRVLIADGGIYRRFIIIFKRAVLGNLIFTHDGYGYGIRRSFFAVFNGNGNFVLIFARSLVEVFAVIIFDFARRIDITLAVLLHAGLVSYGLVPARNFNFGNIGRCDRFTGIFIYYVIYGDFDSRPLVNSTRFSLVLGRSGESRYSRKRR